VYFIVAIEKQEFFVVESRFIRRAATAKSEVSTAKHSGRPVSWKQAVILAMPSGTCTCFVLWQWYVYMFCIVTVVRAHVLYCDSGTCTCFVLWVVRVHVLCCDSGTCTCFVSWQWYAYMFCIVTMTRMRVFYCESGTREKMSENHLPVPLE